MRVLLTIDGSDSASRARDLVAAISWPEGTVIRVVGALERSDVLLGRPWIATTPSDAPYLEEGIRKRLDDALETAIRDLSRPGRSVKRLLLRGRAASEIVAEAVAAVGSTA